MPKKTLRSVRSIAELNEAHRLYCESSTDYRVKQQIYTKSSILTRPKIKALTAAVGIYLDKEKNESNQINLALLQLNRAIVQNELDEVKHEHAKYWEEMKLAHVDFESKYKEYMTASRKYNEYLQQLAKDKAEQ